MRILIMTNERKEQLLDQILELMTAVAYDREPNEVAVPETTKAPAPEKVKMLTVKECTELIDGLSEHTCSSEQDQVYPHRRRCSWKDTCQQG